MSLWKFWIILTVEFGQLLTMTQTELGTWKLLVNRYEKHLVTRSDKFSHDKSLCAYIGV